MKILSRLLSIATILACFTLVSCNKENKSPDGQESKISLSVTRADISGAVALTLCDKDVTKATDAEDISGLYKMDENGNLTYVVFYIEVVTDSTGVETKTAKDMNLTIKPTWIMPYGKDFILLGGCLAEYDGDVTQLPGSLREAIERFCDCFYQFSDGNGGMTGMGSPGYWYLLRKTDGKLFDLSLKIAFFKSSDTTFPSPYPNLDPDPSCIKYYLSNPSSTDQRFYYVNLEREGFLRAVGNEMYVSSLGGNGITIGQDPNKKYKSYNGFISKVTNDGEKLLVSELTNRNLNIGQGFLIDDSKVILTNTEQGIVIINPDGSMQSISLGYMGHDIEWERIRQVGGKWYATLIDDKKTALLINPDGSLKEFEVILSDPYMNYGGIDYSRAPKYVADKVCSFLVQVGGGLGTITIDSATDKVSLSTFPPDFPKEYDMYNDAGVAYVLSEDVKTITRYSIATSSSKEYAVDLGKIPSFIFPKQSFDKATNTFYVTAYNGQDLVSFYIDAETGVASLIGSSTTLKTTTIVPLN
ncbi:MAG: hypothetical protein IJP49_11665 [Bacteroidales bacterium]|nr:hypothetical protein [Bacteroidales bacterium]